MRIMINMQFQKRCLGSVCCQCHRPRTSYEAMTDWLQQGINLFHLSTGRIPTENQYISQQSDLPSNCYRVQCLHHVPLCQRACVYKGWCLDNYHINKHSVVLQTLTLHKGSNKARFYAIKLETFLVYIYRLQLYKFIKTINMFRVGIPPSKNKNNKNEI